MIYDKEQAKRDIIDACLTDPDVSAVYAEGEIDNIINVIADRIAENYVNQFYYLQAKQDEITDLAQNIDAHTEGWLRDRALEFRFNSTTQTIYDYQVKRGVFKWLDGDNDNSAKIITAACIRKPYGKATIMVAKGAVGSLSQLSTAELNAFKVYLRDYLRALGTVITANSRPADTVRLSADVYVDLKYGGIEVLRSKITNSLTSYINSGMENGVLLRSKIEDAIQSVAGVVDYDSLIIDTKPSGASIWTSVARKAEMQSGYATLLIDPALNIIPNN